MARRPFYSWAGSGLAYLPLPASAMVVGLATPFHVKRKDAALVPTLVGLNASVTVQAARGAIDTLHVVP